MSSPETTPNSRGLDGPMPTGSGGGGGPMRWLGPTIPDDVKLLREILIELKAIRAALENQND